MNPYSPFTLSGRYDDLGPRACGEPSGRVSLLLQSLSGRLIQAWRPDQGCKHQIGQSMLGQTPNEPPKGAIVTRKNPKSDATPDTASPPVAADAPFLPVNLVTVASLPSRKPRRIDIRPDAAGRDAMARALGIEDITALMMTGEITAEGRADFRLIARLQARVIQACVVTLEPVVAQIDETIDRLYQGSVPEQLEAEIEIPDEDIEPLPATIDLTAIAIEALSLGLPPYPRAPGAELGVAVFAEPGVKPLEDADLRPFSALAGLASQMAQRKESD
jgi:uncharacterized metal-binding protein YceD (DUF177 family)